VQGARQQLVVGERLSLSLCQLTTIRLSNNIACLARCVRNPRKLAVMIEDPSEDKREISLPPAKQELLDLGGMHGLRSGDWFLKLVGRSLRSYSRNSTADYFRKKYPSHDDEAIASTLISVAARNAALVGATAGATVSADEIAAFFSLGLTAPVNVAVAVAAIGGDLLTLTHIQLKLIHELADLHGIPIDPDDPEDVLVVIGYFMTSEAANAAIKAAQQIGKHLAKEAVKDVFKKETLKLVQQLARQIGVKLLQRTLVNVAVPIVSIGLGASSNYLLTRRVGKTANQAMRERAKAFGIPAR